MGLPLRISPEEARHRVSRGLALLVCAYEDEQKFRSVHLEGAISLTEFRERVPELAKEQEIVFYCA